MIHEEPRSDAPRVEPAHGRPEVTGEQWLGRDRSGRRRLWERLNPRHRRQLRWLAEALALRQSQARLPPEIQAKLSALLDELERLSAQLEKLVAAFASRTRPRG